MIKKGMISVLSALAGLMAGVVMTGRRMGGQIEEKQKKADKHMSLYLMMNQWVKVKQEERIFHPILRERDIRILRFTV